MVVTTTAQLLVKKPQLTVEATEGTTPTASPTFTSLGAVDSLNLKIDGQFVDIAQIGAEDLISIIQGLTTYETQVKMTVNSSSVIKRALNAANYGTPTGTVSETFSMLFSIYLNGTENFIICKGTRAKQVQFTREVGKADEWTIDFVHTTITTPFTTASAGLTTPTFATDTSGAVWGHLDGGADPVTWNSAAQKCKKISITVNRNTEVDHVLGSTDPFSSQPHARRAAGDFTTLWTASTLETDFKAGTARTLTCVVKSATSTITATNATIISYGRDAAAGDTDALVEQVNFRCTSITIT